MYFRRRNALIFFRVMTHGDTAVHTHMREVMSGERELE